MATLESLNAQIMQNPEFAREYDEIARDLRELRDAQAVDDGTRYTHEQVLEELGLSSDSLRR